MVSEPMIMLSAQGAVESAPLRLRKARRLLSEYPLGVAGAVVLAAIAVVAILAPVLAPYSPTATESVPLERPSDEHLLGTDRTGRDVLSRTIWGSRTSLMIGLVAAVLGTVSATVLGLIAGYFQRWPDHVIQRGGEVIAMIPDLVFLFIWVLAFGPGVWTVIGALSFGGAFAGVRVIRGAVLAEKHKDYVEGARAIGAGDGRLMFRHVLPNVASLVVVQATIRLPAVILAEASLSFLGLGIPPPDPSWGSDLGGVARTYFRSQPYIVLAPGIALSLTVLAVSLLGDAIRDALDPRTRGKHQLKG
jgi:peptide/nickel transport system permease protein